MEAQPTHGSEWRAGLAVAVLELRRSQHFTDLAGLLIFTALAGLDGLWSLFDDSPFFVTYICVAILVYYANYAYSSQLACLLLRRDDLLQRTLAGRDSFDAILAQYGIAAVPPGRYPRRWLRPELQRLCAGMRRVCWRELPRLGWPFIPLALLWFALTAAAIALGAALCCLGYSIAGSPWRMPLDSEYYVLRMLVGGLAVFVLCASPGRVFSKCYVRGLAWELEAEQRVAAFFHGPVSLTLRLERAAARQRQALLTLLGGCLLLSLLVSIAAVAATTKPDRPFWLLLLLPSLAVALHTLVDLQRFSRGLRLALDTTLLPLLLLESAETRGPSALWLKQPLNLVAQELDPLLHELRRCATLLPPHLGAVVRTPCARRKQLYAGGFMAGLLVMAITGVATGYLTAQDALICYLAACCCAMLFLALDSIISYFLPYLELLEFCLSWL